MNRPDNSAPTGMGGATRMHDPSEAAHDRVRRRVMNVAFLIFAFLSIASWRVTGMRASDWLTAALLAVAATPLGLAVKVFELRFKMSAAERHQALRELPRGRQIQFVLYAMLILAAMVLNGAHLLWSVWGIWLYDFITYYHDRPERMRHLYAVTRILDELREFPAPWAWPLPVLILTLWRVISAQ